MSPVTSSTQVPFDAPVGTPLPELALPLDRSLIVAAAIASQDFEDVHHDPGMAATRGTPDIFMSINSTNGFIDRYITDVFGPATRIRKIRLKLGVPNFPGETMTFSGEITSREDDVLVLSVSGDNPRGSHVTATVQITSTQPVEGEK